MMFRAVVLGTDWVRVVTAAGMETAHRWIGTQNYVIIIDVVLLNSFFRNLTEILLTFLMTAHQIPTCELYV